VKTPDNGCSGGTEQQIAYTAPVKHSSPAIKTQYTGSRALSGTEYGLIKVSERMIAPGPRGHAILFMHLMAIAGRKEDNENNAKTFFLILFNSRTPHVLLHWNLLDCPRLLLHCRCV
jgi:hypothetical protein